MDIYLVYTFDHNDEILKFEPQRLSWDEKLGNDGEKPMMDTGLMELGMWNQ